MKSYGLLIYGHVSQGMAKFAKCAALQRSNENFFRGGLFRLSFISYLKLSEAFSAVFFQKLMADLLTRNFCQLLSVHK